MEIGSVADWISGVGSLLAVITSLYLANRREKIRLSVEILGVEEPVHIIHGAEQMKVITYELKNFSNCNLQITFFGAKVEVKPNYMKRKRKWKSNKLFILKPNDIIPAGFRIPFKVDANSTGTAAFDINKIYENISKSDIKDTEKIMFYCKDNFGNEYYGKPFELSEINNNQNKSA
ncbi:hypothetical protein RIU76_06700 [Latilactobacillus sakei subsp. sakei]|uniref:hypothetical protein n=1 Tax=Latilactobacillus TaxID=2767885 RepID=UPI000DBB7F4D|nr:MULTISPECIES: hypothetical protein [Latilactobacillus]MDG2984341.1 hypothetical protein [Latilactobacillus curvatus]MDR7924413.1 hypothetical protein [Latilactobacillus sakei subsp. sakei]WBY48570.1 hypothetical protein PGA57_07930 [Latilactobacillus curvatus]BBE26734.1 hypothetical protein NFHkm12_15600 [Latilactobacillus curvatus]